MKPLFNDADQNLLRALPTQTRKAVVELVGRSWKQGVLDTADNIRTATKKALVDDPELAAFMSTFADTITKGANIAELPTFDVPTPDPMNLEDAEILDLPPLDRAKVLADLASQGLILAVMLVDVGVPCPHRDGGKVSMVIDGLQQLVDCTRCDGVGSIDGRRRCADRECLSYDEPLTHSLGGGWECSRKHGHAERERAADVHIAPDEVARFSVTIAHDGIVADVTDYAAVPFAEEARFVTPADLAAVVKVDPVTDPDAFPWDEPSPEAEAARNALDRGHTPGHE